MNRTDMKPETLTGRYMMTRIQFQPAAIMLTNDMCTAMVHADMRVVFFNFTAETSAANNNFHVGRHYLQREIGGLPGNISDYHAGHHLYGYSRGCRAGINNLRLCPRLHLKNRSIL